ncbi:MAG: purine-nucleoside/S-methyl-5-thioadenosine phosphorylase / adenosine deaminase [Frankiales bacterium]|nr:purine-nucleoside/S-methyl-5-thioadenosine phosphorylase / adenosine deaminase [Frankiales bacterium]
MPAPVQLTPVDLGPGVGAVFSTRHGGVSAPPYDQLNLGYHVGDDWDRASANRQLLATAIGSPLERCCYAHQVHGERVLTVGEHQVGTVRTRRGRRDADALVTGVADAPLVILVADCVPVLLADPEARVVGAVHAGRQGLVAGVVGAAVAAMRAAGAGEIRAAIGPSVCAGCYELPADLAAAVDAAVPGTASRTRGGAPSVDLAAGVAAQLAALGVTASRDGRCTIESPELFSHRRDGVTGRFAGVIWLEP